jgi:hypothetical protein
MRRGLRLPVGRGIVVSKPGLVLIVNSGSGVDCLQDVTAVRRGTSYMYGSQCCYSAEKTHHGRVR